VLPGTTRTCCAADFDPIVTLFGQQFRMFYGVPPGEDLRAKSESGPLFTLFGKGDKGRDRKSADHARMYGTCVYYITRVQRGVSIVH